MVRIRSLLAVVIRLVIRKTTILETEGSAHAVMQYISLNEKR